MVKIDDTQYGYFEPLMDVTTIKTVYVSRNGGSILPSAIKTTSTKTKTKDKKTKTKTKTKKKKKTKITTITTTKSATLIVTTKVEDKALESKITASLLVKRAKHSQDDDDDDDADSPTATSTTPTTTSAATVPIKITSVSTSKNTSASSSKATSLPSGVGRSWGSNPNGGWGSDPNGIWGGGFPGGPPGPPGPPPGWVYPNGTAMPPPPPPPFGASGFPMPPPPIAPTFRPTPTSNTSQSSSNTTSKSSSSGSASSSAPTKAPTSTVYTQTWSQPETQSSATLAPTVIPIKSSYKKTNTGAIVGGVVGGTVFLAALIFIFLRRKKRRTALPSNNSELMFETNPSHHWDSGNYRSDFEGSAARAFVPPPTSLPNEGYIPDSPKPTAYYQSPLHTGTSVSAYSPETEADYFDRYPDPAHCTNDYFVPRYSDHNYSESTVIGATPGATTTAPPETDKTLVPSYRDSLKPDTRE